jgi:hypothetical protein
MIQLYHNHLHSLSFRFTMQYCMDDHRSSFIHAKVIEVRRSSWRNDGRRRIHFYLCPGISIPVARMTDERYLSLPSKETTTSLWHPLRSHFSCSFLSRSGPFHLHKSINDTSTNRNDTNHASGKELRESAQGNGSESRQQRSRQGTVLLWECLSTQRLHLSPRKECCFLVIHGKVFRSLHGLLVRILLLHCQNLPQTPSHFRRRSRSPPSQIFHDSLSLRRALQNQWMPIYASIRCIEYRHPDQRHAHSVSSAPLTTADALGGASPQS